MKTSYAELTDSFEQLNLDPIDFKHVDHIGVAFVMLTRYDFLNAMYKYSNTISTMANRAGSPEKFNITITLAFLSIIAERMCTTQYQNADEFIQYNQDLVTGNILQKLYSSERLKSSHARVSFLLPDITTKSF